LANERGRDALRRGGRIARDIFAQSALISYRGGEHILGPASSKDTAFNEHFRNTCIVSYEAVGTCKMSNDGLAVVTKRFISSEASNHRKRLTASSQHFYCAQSFLP
jgi:choline dehydrogenase